MYFSRIAKIWAGAIMYLVFLLAVYLLAATPVFSQCSDSAVWNAFPTTDDLKNLGVSVNEQLRSDSGPTVNQDSTKSFSRYWQGGSSSFGASVKLVIHPDKKLAADVVKKYGEGLTKSNAGVQVSIGDQGFTTGDLMRPYYQIQIGCMVLSYYTSHPRRIPPGDQTPVVKSIVSKLKSLSCCGSSGSGPTTPPANNCPRVVSANFSPASPTSRDIVKLTATATDQDGDPVVYTWEISDLNQKRIATLKGADTSWNNPPTGNYRVRLVVRDHDPNCVDWRDLKVVVLADPTLPNNPPTIRLSVSPNPVSADQDVVVTAVVTDPDGDKFRGGWGGPNTGGFAGGRYPNLQRRPGSTGLWQPVRQRNGDTFTWRGRVEPGKHKMTFGAEDERGALATRTVSFVVVDKQSPLKATLTKIPDKHYIPVQTLNFKVVDNAPAGEKLTYAWWIDGKREKNWTGKSESWSNPSVGYHEIKVQIWKKTGETDTDSIVFEVTAAATPPPTQNTPPKVTITRTTGKPTVANPVNFRASVADPDKNDSHSFTWRIGGKLVGTGTNASWTPNQPGSYTVQVTVSDGSDTGSDSHRFQVEAKPTVTPPPPPPPKRRSIIRNAQFFHANAIHGWGAATRFTAGEKVGLRLELFPGVGNGKIQLAWLDPGQKQARSQVFTVANTGATANGILEDFLLSDRSYPTGIWTVTIHVDGRYDSSVSFELKSPTTGFSAPAGPPSSPTPSGGSPTGPSSSPPPPPSSPAGGWRQVF